MRKAGRSESLPLSSTLASTPCPVTLLSPCSTTRSPRRRSSGNQPLPFSNRSGSVAISPFLMSSRYCAVPSPFGFAHDLKVAGLGHTVQISVSEATGQQRQSTRLIGFRHKVPKGRVLAKRQIGLPGGMTFVHGLRHRTLQIGNLRGPCPPKQPRGAPVDWNLSVISFDKSSVKATSAELPIASPEASFSRCLTICGVTKMAAAIFSSPCPFAHSAAKVRNW